jgi:hypothetical protein
LQNNKNNSAPPVKTVPANPRDKLIQVIDLFDYCFAENGLTAYRQGKQLPAQTFINHLGEEKYQELVNFCLHYIADLKLPVKRCRPRGYILYES